MEIGAYKRKNRNFSIFIFLCLLVVFVQQVNANDWPLKKWDIRMISDFNHVDVSDLARVAMVGPFCKFEFKLVLMPNSMTNSLQILSDRDLSQIIKIKINDKTLKLFIGNLDEFSGKVEIEIIARSREKIRVSNSGCVITKYEFQTRP